jgi:hypothetical protein
MNLKQWLLGCLNSALKKAVDLALIILTAFSIGGHLDFKTLIYTTSVGFVTGIFVWVSANPLPDDPSTGATTLTNIPPDVDLKDK